MCLLLISGASIDTFRKRLSFCKKKWAKKRPRGCSAVAKLGSKNISTVTVTQQVDSAFTSNSECSVVDKCDFNSSVADSPLLTTRIEFFLKFIIILRSRNKMCSHYWRKAIKTGIWLVKPQKWSTKILSVANNVLTHTPNFLHFLQNSSSEVNLTNSLKSSLI